MEYRGEVRPLIAPVSTPTSASPRVARWADHAALAAFLFWAAVYGTRRLGGADYWWHLAFGRYVWDHRALPDVDVFTFTAHGAPWVNVSWLADLLLYAIHSVGGVAALGALTTALVCGSYAAAAWAGHRAGRSILYIPAATLALGLHWGRFVLRPFLISSLLSAVVVGLIERDRRRYARGASSPGVALWALVPLAWFWSCSHGAFVMVYGLVGAYGLEVLLQHRPASDADDATRIAWRRRIVGLALVGASCVIATLVQPYGFGAFGRIGEMMGSQVWRSTIGEWQHMYEYAARAPALAARWYGLWALIVVSFLSLGWRRGSLFRVCAIVGPGLLAFDAVRHLDVFLYIAVPVLACNFHDAWEARGERVRGWLRNRPRVIASGAVVWAAGVILCVGIGTARYTSGRYMLDHATVPARAWDTAPFAYPVAPMDHLLAHPTGGRVFNAFEHGGYVFWRQYPQPVFADSKGLDEQQFLAYADVLDSHDAFHAAVTTYDLRAVVMTLSPRWAGLYRRLLADHTWRLEVWDPTGFLFTRRMGPSPPGPPLPSRPDQDVPRFAPRPLPPVQPGTMRGAPIPLAEQTIATFWAGLDMPHRAAAAYRAAIDRSPHHAPTRVSYADTVLRLGHPAAALSAIEHVDKTAGRWIAAQAQMVRARVAMGAGDWTTGLAFADSAGTAAGEAGYQLRLQIRVRAGDLDGATAEGERWLRRFRRSTAARNDLAVVYNARGESARAVRLIAEAIALEPHRGDLHYTRGLVLQSMGQATDANAAFAEAKRLGFTPDGDVGR